MGAYTEMGAYSGESVLLTFIYGEGIFHHALNAGPRQYVMELVQEELLPHWQHLPPHGHSSLQVWLHCQQRREHFSLV